MNCQCFAKYPHPTLKFDGLCMLYPKSVEKTFDDFCMQFRLNWEAQRELSLTSIDVLFQAHTINVLRRAKIRTLQDLIDVGRTAITTNGYLDRHAITEIEKKLGTLGIRW